eukprot:m.467212 g.467212  ORF g.467212 m.467212 type:complete len:369 (+) comp57063_c1_seq21:222-1328(+)
MPGGGPLVLLLLGLALAAPLRPAHPPDKTKLELDGKINSLVAELTIKAHRRDYVKKTPEFPLFDPPPFSDTPRDQPVCSEADAAFVCVLQSNHRHIHGVVYVFHGVGMPPTDWFQLADRDALLDKLNLVGFHVVIPKASYKLQWEFTNDTRHIQGVMKAMEEKYGWSGLPRFAVGGSAGSNMVAHIMTTVSPPIFAATALYVPDFTMLNGSLRSDIRPPPTVVIQMENDPLYVEKVNEPFLAAMTKRGVETQLFLGREHPLSAELLRAKARSIGSGTITHLLWYLITHSLVDLSGKLKGDLRESSLALAEASATVLIEEGNSDPARAFKSGMQVVLASNAQHSFTGEFNSDVVAFFMRHAALFASQTI